MATLRPQAQAPSLRPTTVLLFLLILALLVRIEASLPALPPVTSSTLKEVFLSLIAQPKIQLSHILRPAARRQFSLTQF